MPTSVIENDGIFPNARRADVMRHSMENKNLLAQKGSLYVGKGINHSVNSSSDNVANTGALNISNGKENDAIIVTNASADLGLEYRLLSDLEVGKSNKVKVNVGSGVTGITSGYKELQVVTVLPSSPSEDMVYLVVEA